MNVLFIIAACVLILLGVAHAVLGEKLLIIPLTKEKSVDLFKKKPFTKNVIRFAWHITSISWWGMALVIIDLAGVENPPLFSVHALAGTSLVTGLIVLIFSRGFHPAWIFFFVTAGCLWVGL